MKIIKKLEEYFKNLEIAFEKKFPKIKEYISRVPKIAYLLVFLLIVYLLINKICFWLRVLPQKAVLDRISYVFSNPSIVLKGGIISINKTDLLIPLFIIIFFALSFFLAYQKGKFKVGKEYGSARFGNKKDCQGFMAEKFEDNIILSETEMMTIKNPKDMKFARNKNIIVIGGSGSGKTRFFVKPNIMQMHSSYVVTDPKGTLVLETGKMLEENGYVVKIFNTVDFQKSMHYNPFKYIRKEEDILTFIETLIANTQGDGQKTDFWVNAEKMYYSALVGYIWYELPEEDQNMDTLVTFVNSSSVSDDEENMIDKLMSDLEEREPNHFAVNQYKKFKLGGSETVKSVLISCGVRLSPFDTKALSELTAYDDLDLEALGEVKSALFIIISDTNPTFNFLVSIMYTQLFNILCESADIKHNGKLPVHVRFLLDEFANIGKIPDFEKLIATIRSREISACPILQTKSQLKSLYRDGKDETIIGNCDTMLFLGGSERSTLEEISKMLGKETIDIANNSLSRGKQGSSSISYQKLGRELLTVDELALLANEQCIVRIRGVPPFLSRKFNIEKHKKYKNLLDYNQANFFNISEYFKRYKKNELDLNNSEILFNIEESYIDDSIIEDAF